MLYRIKRPVFSSSNIVIVINNRRKNEWNSYTRSIVTQRAEHFWCSKKMINHFMWRVERDKKRCEVMEHLSWIKHAKHDACFLLIFLFSSDSWWIIILEYWNILKCAFNFSSSKISRHCLKCKKNSYNAFSKLLESFDTSCWRSSEYEIVNLMIIEKWCLKEIYFVPRINIYRTSNTFNYVSLSKHVPNFNNFSWNDCKPIDIPLARNFQVYVGRG